MKKYKLAILTSHPIQYQVPLFKELAAYHKIDLMVYFCCDYGIKGKKDSGFGKVFKWDIPLIEGYKYKFLKDYSLSPKPSFWGQINPGIISEFKKNKYDGVVVNGWMGITNWFVFLSNTPTILRGENPLNQELLKSTWKIKIKKIILGKLFKKIKAFLFIGEENKKFYQFYNVPEEKLFFTPYAVDNNRFISEAKNLKTQISGLKSRIGIDPNSIVILFVGKLIEKKQPFDLLKAYEKLITQLPNYQLPIVLLFVGDGILRPALEDYVKKHSLKNIYFVGFKNQTELPFYYTIGDIFVLPSGVGETWGLVVNEAMCFKLPIIISSITGCVKDLVKHGENGYFFSLGDIDKLAFYLGDLVENREKRIKFGEKSFEIIQDYSYEKDIDGILKALVNFN